MGSIFRGRPRRDGFGAGPIVEAALSQESILVNWFSWSGCVCLSLFFGGGSPPSVVFVTLEERCCYCYYCFLCEVFVRRSILLPA